MKKRIALVFAWLYVFTLSGITLNFHFCGESLSCVSLFTPDDCCACPSEEDQGCCDDEGLYLKATDDSHTPTTGNYSYCLPGMALIEAPIKFSLRIGSNTNNRKVNAFHAYDLPPPHRIILFRRLLI
jgi:hypothetical protein